jgi:hypothetical protein
MDRESCVCALRRAEELEMHRRRVAEWAREIKRATAPFEGGYYGGFAEGPIYPVLPAFAPVCAQLCRSASALLESH